MIGVYFTALHNPALLHRSHSKTIEMELRLQFLEQMACFDHFVAANFPYAHDAPLALLQAPLIARWQGNAVGSGLGLASGLSAKGPGLAPGLWDSNDMMTSPMPGDRRSVMVASRAGNIQNNTRQLPVSYPFKLSYMIALYHGTLYSDCPLITCTFILTLSNPYPYPYPYPNPNPF